MWDHDKQNIFLGFLPLQSVGFLLFFFFVEYLISASFSFFFRLTQCLYQDFECSLIFLRHPELWPTKTSWRKPKTRVTARKPSNIKGRGPKSQWRHAECVSCYKNPLISVMTSEAAFWELEWLIFNTESVIKMLSLSSICLAPVFFCSFIHAILKSTD